jgi:hypothetical protein
VLGVVTIISVALASVAYFFYIQNYINDPQKKARDIEWLERWEPVNRKRASENELRRPSIDRLLRKN